ncbi:hypothetical protein BST24_02360 [Mycobacteroides franklinii]|nr:hypothetical protein BST24_02360 [Mycobacteroides franklinii]
MSNSALAGPVGNFTVGSSGCCELDDGTGGLSGDSLDSLEQAEVNASVMTLAPTANTVLISTRRVLMAGL